ncbi:MAG: hypothetical protein ACREKL_13795, partial [Chthoniobacterales bacterium]
LWIAQGLGLPGLLSYYAAPLLYFCGTALFVFWIARTCDCDRWIALAAVAIYALHPYQDTVFSRPMPDLSEGFWAAGALFCWMRGKGRFSVLAVGGLCLALAASNRITGLFAAFALGIAALVCEPRRWKELAALAGMTLAFLMIEWTFWACMTGDFLAVLHANLGGRGRAGTGQMPAWELPFRFFQYLWANAWESVLSGLLLLGVAAAWRDVRARTVLAMALVWWLAISCAVQGLDPVRPMLRTSGRFLAGLSPLLAVAGACGLAWLASLLPAMRRGVALALLFAIVVAGMLLSARTTRRETFPEEVAQVVAATPAGRRVLADPAMQRLAILCNESAARKLNWDVRRQMVVSTPELEAAAVATDEIWFFRSKVWNWVLSDLRAGKLRAIPKLAPWLNPPFDAFWPRRVIARGQLPEFNFLSRSHAARPQAAIPQANAVDLEKSLFPKGRWSAPVEKLARGMEGVVYAAQLESRSSDLEPFMAWIEFLRGGKLIGRVEFEPPGFPELTKNTWFFEFPAGCDACRFRIQIRDAVHIESVWTAFGLPAQE